MGVAWKATHFGAFFGGCSGPVSPVFVDERPVKALGLGRAPFAKCLPVGFLCRGGVWFVKEFDFAGTVGGVFPVSGIGWGVHPQLLLVGRRLRPGVWQNPRFGLPPPRYGRAAVCRVYCCCVVIARARCVMGGNRRRLPIRQLEFR